MTADLLEASSEVSRDLSPEWLELSARVRQLAVESGGSSALAESALKLCDHVERLHADVEELLNGFAERQEHIEAERVHDAAVADPEAIDQANIQIQREMHQKSDLKHIIKALFMWKDDPVERVKDRVD
jgi:predicted nuclease with TOPRIM domain